MGYLTTHVSDTAKGCPGSAMQVRLYRIVDGQSELLSEIVTNSDGRCDSPILAADDFKMGKYELVFEAGDYFRRSGTLGSGPSFVEDVVIRFVISDESDHYHVPLIVSPYSFSTYRGS